MKEVLEILVKAAKDFKEYKSIGNGAKLNIAIEKAEKILRSESLNISDVKQKRVSGFVAMNKNEYDIENMSFYKTKKKATQEWGNKQHIAKAQINFS